MTLITYHPLKLQLALVTAKDGHPENERAPSLS